ncbi:MAG: UTP--glucose-1-phosphate uridylyltransferase [Rubripirellula sp.]
MSSLVDIILSDENEVRNRSLDSVCSGAELETLLGHCQDLDHFRRQEDNLYHRVRALFFLSAIYRYHLPKQLNATQSGYIPYTGYEHLLSRRFVEAIDSFLMTQGDQGPCDGVASALAQAYHQLAFQTLADQVRRSVRTVKGNQWMFRLGHPAEQPLRIRPEILKPHPDTGAMPILREVTAVRMDFSHSAWSDIFFLGMDFPEGARVLNASVDLGVRGRDTTTSPPIETYLRVIDRPVIRLTSVDLGTTVEVDSIASMFDFAQDHLGLLKAAVIASGIVPPGLEGCGHSLTGLLTRVVGSGKGIEVVSKINDIPKGSRLAVSTNLLGSLISLMMRATNQTTSLTGTLEESDRRLVAARAILGEWIGGSGGGWQDSGGVWPGIKLIEGAKSQDGDPEFGISRGRLMPTHHVMSEREISRETRQKIQDSLVLVHGGMAQNVGPILEMVTEHYLLRSQKEWEGRFDAMSMLDEIVEALSDGDLQRIGDATTRNFEGPLQTIIPWATNRFTDSLITQCREQFGDQFWGFWMLGGMSGGGMGFIFDPEIKQSAQDWLGQTLIKTKQLLQTSLPFAMDPVVYDFKINDDGSKANFVDEPAAGMPGQYYSLVLPGLLRASMRELSPDQRLELEHLGQQYRASDNHQHTKLLDSILPQATTTATQAANLQQILSGCGFDQQQHEAIRSDLQSGRIGLAQNRLSNNLTLEDIKPGDFIETRSGVPAQFVELGQQAIQQGKVGVVTLAAGVGSRWTEGAGVCKALHPFNRFSGRHRSFIEVHLAKNRKTSNDCNGSIPHVFTTSYLTDDAIRTHLTTHQNHGLKNQVYVSTGRSIGMRMIPMIRDLRFLWEETAQQILDEQQQKMRESARAALMGWAKQMGEGTDYVDNLPHQCIHPVGHWYEVPNMLLNGVLNQMLSDQPELVYLMLHNIDTLGANVDPGLLGMHIKQQNTLSFEVIGRRIDDRGGGLASVNGRPRLVEGLAMPDDEAEFNLTFYNSMTTWISIDQLLASFGLERKDLANKTRVSAAVRQMASRLPTYITLKDVKKRWGHAQEDVFPVAQFEKLWGDMSALPEVACSFFATPLKRGQQLKTQAQLDPWKRDGSADYVDSLCQWK